MNARLIFRFAWRDWRSGELTLLLVALMVAVGTVTAISLFVDRLQQALLSESANFLAADRVVSSSREIPISFDEAAQDLGLATVRTLVFPSMVFSGDDNNQLVSVKAVTEGYPLRGALRTADEPFGDSVEASSIPAPGEAWLDSRLFPMLDVALGDTVEVGYKKLKVTRVLVSEPDRGGSFFDLGPRLLMRVQDVAATEVVQPGSRIRFNLLLRGPDDRLATLKGQLPLEPNYRWASIRESSPTIGQALDRAESFLLLGGLLAVLLAGVAVALGAHRYAQRHFDHVAVLKTLGASPRMIQSGYLGVILLVGAVASLAGLLLGAILHLGIAAILASVFPVTLPAPTVRPLLLGVTTGFICLLAFALPPILRLRNIAPMRVIQRDLAGATDPRVSYLAAIAGTLTLLIWYSGDLRLTLWVLAGAFGVILVFGVLAFLLLKGGRVAGMQAGSVWRLALAGLQRRRGENVAQILIFGLAIMLLLIMVLLRTSLVDEWQARIPENTPNHFLMNILPEQADGVRELIADVDPRAAGAASGDLELFPLIRGRIIGVNGEDSEQYVNSLDVTNDSVPRITSERNLTWATEITSGNVLDQGQWWAPDETRSLISVERDYARAYRLALGDELTFDIGGFQVTATVASIRSVEWDSLNPNFFIVFSPAALTDIPSTYMTSFYLDRDNKQFLNRLLSRYPTISVIAVDAIVRQVQDIVGKVTQAVELVLALVLVSGCLVLLASIHASRDARMAEYGVLRALGGASRLIRGALGLEFLCLGVMAGIVAVFGAELTVLILETQVFELRSQAHPWLWLLGPMIGGGLIALVGLLSTRRLVAASPLVVLRSA